MGLQGSQVFIQTLQFVMIARKSSIFIDTSIRNDYKEGQGME